MKSVVGGIIIHLEVGMQYQIEWDSLLNEKSIYLRVLLNSSERGETVISWWYVELQGSWLKEKTTLIRTDGIF